MKLEGRAILGRGSNMEKETIGETTYYYIIIIPVIYKEERGKIKTCRKTRPY